MRNLLATLIPALLAALLASLLLPLPVSAHKPIFLNGAGTSYETATRIPDPEVSLAVYAELERPAQVGYYVFAAQKGTPLFAQMSIPQIEGLEDFTPSFALVGPGVPSPRESLPFELPAQTGVVLAEAQPYRQPDSFFEPFTQTSYWQRQELRLAAPADGTYYLLVFDRQGRTGKYVMAVGEREEFGPGDVLRFPVIWWQVRWYFEQGPYLVAGLALLVGLVVALAAALMRRGR